MSVDDEGTAGFSLRRWSRRKLDAARATPHAQASPAATAPPEPRPMPPGAAAAAAAGDAPAPVAGALPPIGTLTFDSDFTAFLQPKVDEALKRNALRTQFRDPRFNVMDGLDVYIDDYSVPDPISAEMVRALVQARDIFDPPQTRINAAGHVEDVPADERVAAVAKADAEAPPPSIAATDGTVALVPAQSLSPVGADPAATQAALPAAPSAATDAAVPAAAAPDAAAPIRLHPAPRSDR